MMFTFITNNTPQLGLPSGDNQSVELSFNADGDQQFQDVLAGLEEREAIDTEVEIIPDDMTEIQSDVDEIRFETDEPLPVVQTDQVELNLDKKSVAGDSGLPLQPPAPDSKKSESHQVVTVTEDHAPTKKTDLGARFDVRSSFVINDGSQFDQPIEVDITGVENKEGSKYSSDASFDMKLDKNVEIAKQADLETKSYQSPNVELGRVLTETTGNDATDIDLKLQAGRGEPSAEPVPKTVYQENSIVHQTVSEQAFQPTLNSSIDQRSIQFEEGYSKTVNRDPKPLDSVEFPKAEPNKGSPLVEVETKTHMSQSPVPTQLLMADSEYQLITKSEVTDGLIKDMIVSVTTTDLGQANGSRSVETKVAQVELPRYVATQISEAVKANPRDNVIDLQLSPEELGRVRMTMSANEAAITMVVQADRPETLELLRRNIETLGQQFERLGYSDVSFDFGSDRQAPSDQMAQSKGASDDYGHEQIENTQILAIKNEGLDLRL